MTCGSVYRCYIAKTPHTFKIMNKMNYERNTYTTIQVRYPKNTDENISEFHTAARSLASTWCNEGNKCNRQCVEGGMKHFGVKLGSGNMKHYCYYPTQHDRHDENEICKELNKISKSICADLFPDAYEDIQLKMHLYNKTVPDFLGGKEGLCTEITQSQNSLVTEPHVDQDLSKCMSIWSVEEGDEENPASWYFVLPYLTCIIDGRKYNGIAIKLCHGAAIEWNGRVIFHSTSGPTDRCVNGIGTFFGLTVV